MPRVKSNNIFNLKNSRNANKQQKTICIVVVVVLILVGLFFYLRKNNMLTFMGVKEGFESNKNQEPLRIDSKPNPDDDSIVVLLLYVDWCPHCENFKPEWKKLEALNGTKMNNKTVEVKAVNCEGSEVEKEVANDLGVEGYPTIKVMTKNNVEDYNGARDEASIKNHLETVANQN